MHVCLFVCVHKCMHVWVYVLCDCLCDCMCSVVWLFMCVHKCMCVCGVCVCVCACMCVCIQEDNLYYWGYKVLHYNVFILSFWYSYTDDYIITVIINLDMTQGKVIRRILCISVFICNYAKNIEHRPRSNVLYLHSDLHWTNGGISLTHFCKSNQCLILPMVHYIWVQSYYAKVNDIVCK